MDGYAVRASDIAKASAENPPTLKAVGAIYAGDAIPSWAIEAVTCSQIATGAPLPLGADCGGPFEDTQRDGELVRVLKAHPVGASK